MKPFLAISAFLVALVASVASYPAAAASAFPQDGKITVPPKQAACVQLVSQASIEAGRFRELRDHAIRMLGWIAGNSYGHPVWPEMKPYVGRGGVYYDFFLRLSPPGLDRSAQEVEAFQNVSLYQEWFEKGQTRPFNEADNVNKIRRILQIAREVVDVYR